MSRLRATPDDMLVHEVQSKTQTESVLPSGWEKIALLMFDHTKYLSLMDFHGDDPEIEKKVLHTVVKHSLSQFEAYFPLPPP